MNNNQRSIKKKLTHLGTSQPPQPASKKLISNNPELKKLQNSLKSLNQNPISFKFLGQEKDKGWSIDLMSQNYNFKIQEQGEYNLKRDSRKDRIQNKNSINRKEGNLQQQPMSIENFQKFFQNEQHQEEDINLWEFNFVEEMEQKQVDQLKLQQYVNPYPSDPQQNQYYYINSESHQSLSSDQISNVGLSNINDFSISISSFSRQNQPDREFQEFEAEYNYKELISSENSVQVQKQISSNKYKFDNFFISIDSYQNSQQECLNPQNEQTTNFEIFIKNFDYNEYLTLSKSQQKHIQQQQSFVISSDPSLKQSFIQQQSSSSQEKLLISEQNKNLSQIHEKQSGKVKERNRNASQMIKTKKERKLDKKLSKFKSIKDALHQNQKKRSKTPITSFPLKKQSHDGVQKVKKITSVKLSSIGKFFNDLGKKRSQKIMLNLPSPIVEQNQKKRDKKEKKNEKTQLSDNEKKILKKNEIEQIQKKMDKSNELNALNKERLEIQKPKVVKVSPQQVLEKQMKQLIKKLWHFKRPKELQYKLNNFSQSNKFNSYRSQLISCLLFNNVYFQNLGLKIPLAPKVPLVYQNMQEYKRVFAANIRNEMYYEIRQKVKKIIEKQNKLGYGQDLNSSARDSETQILDKRNFVEMNEQQSECKKLFTIKIKDQEHLEREGMYQLNGMIVTNKNENKFLHMLSTNISNYKSKYKLFLLVCQVHIQKKLCLCSVLCQIKEIRMPHQKRQGRSNPLNQQQSQVEIGLMIGIDINSVVLKQNEENANGKRGDSILPIEGSLYDLGRVVTPIRQYQAVTNLKFNRLLPILLDPRTIHQDQHKFNNLNNYNTNEPYKSQLNQLIQTTIKQTYNISQYQSIKQISEFSQGVQLLQGPPGTGKTSTLLGILSCQYLRLSYYNNFLEEIHEKRKKIKEVKGMNKNLTGIKSNLHKDLDMESESDFLNSVHHSSKLKNQTKQEKVVNYLKILVCTPSNSAIDLITSKILEQGLYLKNKNNEQERADEKKIQEWSGLDIYKKLCKSINTINIEEKNNREISREQLDKSNQKQKSNIKNRKFPRILRIGLIQQEVETNLDHLKQEQQVQMKEEWRDINIKPYKYEEMRVKYLDHKNFNLYYLVNSLFAHEMKNFQKYISNQQVRSKLTTLQADIKQIKSLILTIVRNFNELSNDCNVQVLRLNSECNCIINNLYNTFSIKTSIASSLNDILCGNLYFDCRNKVAPSNNHNIKDVIKFMETRIICSSEILLTTLTTSYSQKIISSNPTFISLIVDEAAQCTQPNILIPLQYGINKVILIGDHCQLPATIKNPELIKGMYSRSLFQRFWQSYSQNIQKYLQDIQENLQLHKKKQKQHFHRLNTQYRMDPLICQFPNKNFYQSKLATADSVKERSKGEFYFKVKSVCFLDCLKSQEQKMCNSFMNKIEGQCVVGIILKILKNFSQRQMLSMKQVPISIGIITPYIQQQNYIKKLLRQKKSLLPASSIKNINVTVSTVDSYQGQERDIILISTVRSNLTGNVGFLYDQRRINVALTRARYSLVVVGNSSTLSANETWNKYIGWVRHKGTYLQYQGLETNNGVQLSLLLSQIFEENQRVSQSIKMKNRFKELYEKNIANFPIMQSQASRQMIDEGDIIRIQRNNKRIFDRIDY